MSQPQAPSWILWYALICPCKNYNISFVVLGFLYLYTLKSLLSTNNFRHFRVFLHEETNNKGFVQLGFFRIFVLKMKSLNLINNDHKKNIRIPGLPVEFWNSLNFLNVIYQDHKIQNLPSTASTKQETLWHQTGTIIPEWFFCSANYNCLSSLLRFYSYNNNVSRG